MIDRRQRRPIARRLSPRPRPVAAAAVAASSSSESPSSPSSSSSSSASKKKKKKKRPFIVRRAIEDDWWHLSQVHCAAFFPSTPGPLVPLFRLDRVLGIEAGVSNELKRRGRFACLVAVQVADGGESGDEEEEEEGEEEGRDEETEGAATSASAPSPSPLSFPLSLLPRQLHGLFETLEGGAARAGVLGTVCVDAQGCQLPPRKLPLRQRSAAVASFVSLVAPNAPAVATSSSSSSSAPPPPPSGLRAPPGAVAYLSNLAVSPSARQLGVARALLAAAEREAWGWGARSVALHVGRDNAAAAGLYLSSGFRAVGGALPLVDPKAAEKDGERTPVSARQQLAGGPLTLMLKVAPREVVARRAREAAAAAAEAKGREARVER